MGQIGFVLQIFARAQSEPRERIAGLASAYGYTTGHGATLKSPGATYRKEDVDSSKKLVTSIGGRRFRGGVDHHCVHRHFTGFQLQPELRHGLGDAVLHGLVWIL